MPVSTAVRRYYAVRIFAKTSREHAPPNFTLLDVPHTGMSTVEGCRAGGKNIRDAFGREFSAHWHVAPGVEVDVLGIFSISVTLEVGPNAIEVTASDLLGNVRSQTVVVFRMP